MRSNTSANAMQINRVTLAFCGRHASLEAPFLDDLFHSHLRTLRCGITLCIVFLAGFGLYDAYLVPDKKALLWTIRWAIFCPLLFLLFATTFSNHFQRFMEPILSAMIIVSGLCFTALILVAQSENVYTYSNGLVQSLFLIHAMIKLRFTWRVPATCCLIALYAGIALCAGITPRNILIADLFNLTCINTIGLVAAYIIEYRTRRNFYLSRQLESKKRRLSMTNQFLEKRVAKRTADLSRTNELLKGEIHERKTADRALRKSERRFHRMVDNVSDFMCVHDLEGNILDANRKMIEGLGYNHTELCKMNLNALLLSGKDFDLANYLNTIRQKGHAIGKMTLLTKKGHQRRFEYSNVLAEHTADQRVVYCLARDITQHQLAEDALAESQANFKNIFDTAAAGMMIVHVDSRKVIEFNQAAADLIGAKVTHIKKMCIDDLIDWTNKNVNAPGDISTPHPVECNLITKQQTRIPILKSTQGTVLKGEPHWIVSFVNIQQIKEAEAAKRTLETRLNQAHHLQSIGTLAGGIAHDFNNILFGMLGFTELALDDAVEDSLQAANLKEILQGGQRAKEMISQILAFSRQDNAEKHPLKPAKLINEALKLLRASLPATIDIQSHLNDEVGSIDANPTQIHQVVMNLCTNAAYAMSTQGSCLKIELKNETLAEDEVTPNGKTEKGKYVCIRISDDGIGIPTDILNRIFEPFFTTKSQGEGTGMGLSVAIGIIQTHNGTIRVRSQLGKGSCFDILLPMITVAEDAPEPYKPKLPGGSEHILYVDDEKPITIMAKQMLSKLGYKVTSCTRPNQALKLMQADPQQFDLLITDLTMPQMTGVHLAQELLKINPGLPIMLCTGYGDQITKENIHTLGICELMFKPIQKAEIATAIRRALSLN